MAYKILGQLAAAATTEEGLYAVPASSSAVVSTIVIANRGTTSATYRIAVKPTAATTLANVHYIAYDVPIAPNDSTALTLGVTLAATNAIRTYASNTNLTFSAFGTEL
jgi:methenyltetrahydromethanopterin cyclohydrolase